MSGATARAVTRSVKKKNIIIETAPGTKKRILIVDDEPRILRIVRLMLKVSGYEVITAVNGLAGLRMVETAKPDAILLDMAMPVMDGFEMLQRLRTYSQLPVIVFSASDQVSAKALGLGADDFVARPFRPEELEQKIRSILPPGCRTP